MKEALKVYIADDHTVVRSGMIRLLRTFARIGALNEAANGKELISLIENDAPDAVIIDLEMPVMGGYDTARYVLDHFPAVKVLVLTMHSEDVMIDRLVELGVNGFLTKSAQPAEVEEALYAIVDKDFYRNQLVADALLRSSHKKAPQETGNRLSARELEILLLICQEYTPGEISDRLHISEKTFFNHRANILAKTGVRGNVGLVKYAHERKIISLK
jgi:two-component system, NarL family, response regulator DegU